MIFTRVQNLQAIARRLANTPQTTTVSRFGIFSSTTTSSGNSNISGIRMATSSSSSSPSSGDIKFPFKVAPVDVKPPEEYNVLPDPIELATGLEKKQLLAQLQGDDRYEAKVYHIRAGTKDDPNIIPSHLEARIVGCICEPDQHHVNYMWLRKDTPKRCECGHWFKLVEAEPDLF